MTHHNSIMFELDEAYCFHLENKHGRLDPKRRLEIPFYGKVEIAYRDTDDWWVRGIELSASNGKMGKECEGWEEEIFHNHQLWKPIERYLQDIVSDDVSEQIRVDIQSQIEDYNFQRGKDKARGLLY